MICPVLAVWQHGAVLALTGVWQHGAFLARPVQCGRCLCGTVATVQAMSAGITNLAAAGDKVIIKQGQGKDIRYNCITLTIYFTKTTKIQTKKQRICFKNNLGNFPHVWPVDIGIACF